MAKDIHNCKLTCPSMFAFSGSITDQILAHYILDFPVDIYTVKKQYGPTFSSSCSSSELSALSAPWLYLLLWPIGITVEGVSSGDVARRRRFAETMTELELPNGVLLRLQDPSPFPVRFLTPRPSSCIPFFPLRYSPSRLANEAGRLRAHNHLSNKQHHLGCRFCLYCQVTWDTSNQPSQITNPTDQIYLPQDPDATTQILLMQGFQLTAATADVTVLSSTALTVSRFPTFVQIRRAK